VVVDRLGDPEPFFPDGTAFGKHAQFSIAPGKEGTGEHGGRVGETETLAAPLPVKERHGLSEVVDCLTIAGLGRICLAKA
jgi:hypothetical protein